MKFVLSCDYETGEGDLSNKFVENIYTLDRLTALDFLQCWIGLLTELYEDRLNEAIPLEFQ